MGGSMHIKLFGNLQSRVFSTAALILLLPHSQLRAADVRFDNFAAPRGLQMVGAASVTNGALRLTPAKRGKTGAVWLTEKQPVLAAFETTFQFQFTHSARIFGGADGLAFVIQNSGPQALGGRGSAGGFGVEDKSYSHEHPGIPWSFAVFFDTFQNQGEGDPSDNFVALRSTGRPADMKWPAERLAMVPKLDIQLKDQAVHTARIVYRRPVIQIFLDHAAAPVLESTLDLQPVADQEGKAWIGFTASTGLSFENHDLLNWSFRGEDVSSSISVVSSEISFPMSDCLPDHNLCTPEQSFVSGSQGHYHVVLPGNRKWGVRIPNVPDTEAAITNAHGVICWDVEARGPAGCTGPAGAPEPAVGKFLDPAAPPGALIHRADAEFTYFSVNGRSDSGFNKNEGFFEFDVEFRPRSNTGLNAQ
jgi:hypothetical protein